MADRNQNGGKAVITAALLAYTNRPRHYGWGTGTGAAATATNLVTPAAPTTTTAQTGTDTQQTTTLTNDTYQVITTITAGSALAITEAGSFGSTTMAANLFNYHDFAAVNVVSGDAIEFTDKTIFA